jgi:hypothetical protein
MVHLLIVGPFEESMRLQHFQGERAPAFVVCVTVILRFLSPAANSRRPWNNGRNRLSRVAHLKLLGNEPRAIYNIYLPGGEPMEKRHPLTVNEGDTREVQGEAPAFGKSLITRRIECIDSVACDLTF